MKEQNAFEKTKSLLNIYAKTCFCLKKGALQNTEESFACSIFLNVLVSVYKTTCQVLFPERN